MEQTTKEQTDGTAGAKNLVEGCMRVARGDRVLLVMEPQDERHYDDAIGERITDVLTSLGANVSVLRPQLIKDPVDFPADLSSAMSHVEHTLFLSRIGDYLRFTPMMGNGKVTICYTRHQSELASHFASFDHGVLATLQEKLENELLSSTHWRITCELGTDIQGTFCWPSQRGGVDDDFSMQLFPVSTFKPVPGDTANGTVALSRWLMPGAAIKVEPGLVQFDGPVFAQVENGVLQNLSGNDVCVDKVRGHMDHICSSLDIPQKNIHSWHLGINPFTAFNKDVNSNLIEWGSISFASPRYLHFHTTGEKPPGEIAWSIFHPTVYIDDVCFWQNGEFVWLERDDNRAILDQIPSGHLLLGKSADIGI